MENNKEQLREFVDGTINKLKEKNFNIYFYCSDTKGNPIASVAQIYEHVTTLNKNDYKAFVMYDCDDYTPVSSWLGEEYSKTPVVFLTKKVKTIDPKTNKEIVKIEPVDVKITTSDFLVIPEFYANVMQQIGSGKTKSNCGKIVLCQNYSYISEVLTLDKTWGAFGFNDVITTSEELAGFINEITPTTQTQVVPVVVNNDLFIKTIEPKKPIISFVTKDQADFRIITNMFYRKYPMFRWFTPRDLRTLNQKDYAEALKESCVLVWADRRSSYGTAPIESMMCGVPVIGVIPDLIPGWLKENENETFEIKSNGVWVGSVLEIADVLGVFCQGYLEDTLPEYVYESMDKTILELNTKKEQIEQIKGVYVNLFNKRIEYFEQLKKDNEL